MSVVFFSLCLMNGCLLTIKRYKIYGTFKLKSEKNKYIAKLMYCHCKFGPWREHSSQKELIVHLLGWLCEIDDIQLFLAYKNNLLWLNFTAELGSSKNLLLVALEI